MTEHLSPSGFVLTILCVVGLVASALPTASAYRLARPDKASLTFRHDARGQHAFWDAEWRLSSGAAGQLGLIVGAAVCGDEAFLLDRRFQVVHRIDLSRGSIVGRLGDSSESSRLDMPTGLAADCEGRKVYVVDSSGVVVFDAESGHADARFAKPYTFVNSIGPAILDGGEHALYVPGLWTPAKSDWLVKPVQRMFEGDGLGYRLDLSTGSASPMLPAVERGCWSLGPNCLFAMLDRVRGSSAAGWIAAHRVGTSVGVFDSASHLVRSIDVRSPLFLDNADQNGSTSLLDMVAWNERNSVLRRCFSFDGVIATVHSFNRTINWRGHQQIDFEVFMNVHSLQGDRLTSDIKLPDLPVGRDDTSLYVVDHGPEGRRGAGSHPISLLRIPVAANLQRLH